MADGKGFSGLLDMINGGGMGAAGSRFEGGPLSGLLNALGIRPYGYEDRLSEMRPQARPTGLPDLQPVIPISQRPVARPQNAGSPLSMFGGQEPNSSPMVRYDQMPAEIGNSGSGMGLPQYSGRGTVGMPMNPVFSTPEERAVLEYLRSVGAVNY